MWTAHPHRLLFLLMVPLAWVGVLPWFLVGIGAVEGYPSVFHSIAQIQGFLAAIVAGFLLRVIPRSTGSGPPSRWLVGLCALAPVGTVSLAACERFGASQLPWFALITALVVFVRRRWRAAGRRACEIAWVPLSFGVGVVGSLLIGCYGMVGERWFSLHQLGKLMLVQGMPVCLLVGLAGAWLPWITRGARPGRRFATLFRWLLVGLTATFALETFGPQWPATRAVSHGLRALLVSAVLIGAAQLHRPPVFPGASPRLVWVATWCLPLGYAVAAAFPYRPHVGLHLVFIGGFAGVWLGATCALTRSIGRVGLALLGAMLTAAIVARSMMLLDSTRTLPWMAVSSGSFLLATLVWLGLAWQREPAPCIGGDEAGPRR